GVFMRCEGLNANRFSGKGQSDDLWNSVFQYYMDLFLADLLLSHIREILAADPGFSRRQTAFCKALRGLFSSENVPAVSTIADLVGFLRDLRGAIDVEVNNCAIKKHLNIQVHTTRGRLVFGIPELLGIHF